MRIFKQTAHILLSLTLILSTMGITMNKHYCMGRVQDVAYFHAAHNCMEKAGMDDGMGCPMDCCDDTSEEFKINELDQTSFQVDLSTNLVLLFIFEFQIIESHQAKGQINFTSLRNQTALLTRDIPLEVQSFLL